MKKSFINKIKREGVVDTKNYRYNYRVCDDGAYIERIELDKLDTLAAYDQNNWKKIVKVF